MASWPWSFAARPHPAPSESFDETTAFRWVTVDEATELADEAFAIRVQDALTTHSAVSIAAMDSACEATPIFEGYGFMKEYAEGRFYCDAKIFAVGKSTSVVQRILIAHGLPALS
ncbi:hypothetical protein [Actinomadura roseirufa]|uniref:hypothetical protein n=1 Tax=Actinomadura roseirufa TaxID=2094049 RepID=UPI003520E61B